MHSTLCLAILALGALSGQSMTLSVEVKNCCDFGDFLSFLRPSFVCRRLSAPSLATAECSLFMGMQECQDGGLCQDEGSSGREF